MQCHKYSCLWQPHKVGHAGLAIKPHLATDRRFGHPARIDYGFIQSAPFKITRITQLLTELHCMSPSLQASQACVHHCCQHREATSFDREVRKRPPSLAQHRESRKTMTGTSASKRANKQCQQFCGESNTCTIMHTKHQTKHPGWTRVAKQQE